MGFIIQSHEIKYKINDNHTISSPNGLGLGLGCLTPLSTIVQSPNGVYAYLRNRINTLYLYAHENETQLC